MARSLGDTEHNCHARDCDVRTSPRMLMCIRHWRMVPREMQDKVWQLYRDGQEISKTPSREYLTYVRTVISYVARAEHRDCTDCSNINSCCMEHRIHVDGAKPHTRCILR